MDGYSVAASSFLTGANENMKHQHRKRRVHNVPRHRDFVSQRREYEARIRDLETTLGIYREEKGRIKLVLEIGRYRLIKVVK